MNSVSEIDTCETDAAIAPPLCVIFCTVAWYGSEDRVDGDNVENGKVLLKKCDENMVRPVEKVAIAPPDDRAVLCMNWQLVIWIVDFCADIALPLSAWLSTNWQSVKVASALLTKIALRTEFVNIRSDNTTQIPQNK